MGERKITLEKDGNLIRIGDKWYAFQVNDDGDFRTGEHILVEVDKKQIDKKIAAITKTLFSFVDPQLVLKDALKDMTEAELTHIYKYIKRHRGKIKPKIKKHCIQMRIAGISIPLR